MSDEDYDDSAWQDAVDICKQNECEYGWDTPEMGENAYWIGTDVWLEGAQTYCCRHVVEVEMHTI